MIFTSRSVSARGKAPAPVALRNTIRWNIASVAQSPALSSHRSSTTFTLTLRTVVPTPILLRAFAPVLTPGSIIRCSIYFPTSWLHFRPFTLTFSTIFILLIGSTSYREYIPLALLIYNLSTLLLPGVAVLLIAGTVVSSMICGTS